MQRLSRLIICLFLLLFAAGCIFPYCVYPRLDYTKRVKLDCPRDEVRAFRVDISKPTGDINVFVGPVFERLSEIPATNRDEIPRQIKPSMTRGFVVIGVALNFLTHTSHSIAVRLYRPGYELVEVKSWEPVNKVIWKPAASLETQEKVLDRLFPIDRLESGSKDSAHREALLFAATEYERLATAGRTTEQQSRLGNKVNRLRDLAKQ